MRPRSRIFQRNPWRRSLISLTAAFALAGCIFTLPELAPEEAAAHRDAKARVCGVVASAKHAADRKGSPTFLNLGQPFPHHVFSAVIWADARTRFDYAPESLEGESICVEGVIGEFQGRPQIVVSTPSQIRRAAADPSP